MEIFDIRNFNYMDYITRQKTEITAPLFDNFDLYNKGIFQMDMQMSKQQLIIYTIKNTLVYKRVATATKVELEQDGDTLIFSGPITGPGKEKDNFLMHPDCIFLILQYHTDRVITKRLHRIVIDSLETMLKRRDENKVITFIGNDILVNNKKVAGDQDFKNSTGFLTFTPINFNYDETFFRKHLTEEQLLREKNGIVTGITGIKNEYPGWDKEEFIKELVDSIVKKVKQFEMEEVSGNN